MDRSGDLIADRAEREIDAGGTNSQVYTLYFNVGRYVVILVATDLYGGWTWNLVLSCAQAPPSVS